LIKNIKIQKHSEMKNLLFTTLFAIISISVISQTDVLPPVLNVPADDATNQMPNAELDWYAVNGNGQITYELQVDTSDLFENPVIYFTIVTAQKAENLLFGNVYFWRVRATDNSGTSGWSVTRSFTVFDQVALSKPDDGIENQMPDVTLIWSNRKGPTVITGLTYYDLQVSPTEDFSDLFYVDSITFGTFPADTNFYLKKTSNLLFDTTFYWRVRARHALDASEWSDARSFSTISGVTLTSPASNAVNQNADIELKWEAISGVYNFVYQVCTDPEFTFPCITNFTETNSVIIPNLAFGSTYFWRIRAVHLLDTTDWSDERNFQVINTVLLSSPANGASGINSLPTLSWTPIAGADQYEVRWNNEDNSVLDTAFTPTASYLMFKPLDIGEDYFWKVRAINNLDTTNWSETWQFHTGQQGTGDISLTKAIINLYPNPSSGIFTMELNSDKQSTVRITVLDFIGKIVFDENYSFGPGLETRNINLYNLNNGLYFIKFRSGDTVYTEKLIIDK
jgi:hypothetical protein